MLSSNRDRFSTLRFACTILPWVLLLLLQVSGTPVMAGRNAGGAMLLHANDSVHWVYRQVLDPCTDSPPSAPLPPTCDELNTETDIDPNIIESVIWMVGAFPDGSSPAVTAFQVGLYGNVYNGDISAYAPCGPVLEIPDIGWPGSGTGTAVTYTGGAVTSHLYKMYWFAAAPYDQVHPIIATGNYYQGDGLAEWVDDSNPPQVDSCSLFGSVGWGFPGQKNCPAGGVTGACCFPGCECQVLTHDSCESMGGSYYGDGTTCVPDPCDCPPGACCFTDGSCQVTTQFQCESEGGVFQGAGTVCSPNPCLPPTGACCFCDSHCEELTADACVAAGGSFLGLDIPCSPNPCPAGPTGACCVDQQCSITLERCCAGQYQGDNTVCDPNPCNPTPTKATTWGRIKAGYR